MQEESYAILSVPSGTFLLGLPAMSERSFASQSKRGFDVIMTKEDYAALTQLLRRNFSPLEIVAVDFRTKELLVLESLADAPELFTLYITNPDPDEPSLERLRTALLFCDDGRTEVFRNSLPRRQAGYHRSNGTNSFTTKFDGRGQPVEVLRTGNFHFTYDRNDAEAHRFANKMIRLLSKMLVNQFAIVDAETNEFIRESGPTFMLKVGPGALESCRQHPYRYMGVGGMRDEETRLFLAPLPPERYEELKRKRRKAKVT